MAIDDSATPETDALGISLQRFDRHRSGAMRAMQEVVAQGNRWVAGTLVCFNSPKVLEKWKEIIGGNKHEEGNNHEKEKKHKEREKYEQLRLLAALWCNWGTHDGKPWVAVSLWRVLALIGRVLFACKRLRSLTDEQRKAEEKRVNELLKRHGETTVLPDPMGSGLECPPKPHCVFPEWRFDVKAFEGLAGELVTWRQSLFSSQARITLPTAAPNTNSNSPKAWEECFIRRLHGQYLVGDFWRHLSLRHIEKPDRDWNVGNAIGCWIDTLLDYWEPIQIYHDLRTCPLLTPLVDSAKHREGIETSPFWKADALAFFKNLAVNADSKRQP